MTRVGDSGGAISFQFPKTFYVSPFLRVQGEYELFLTETANDVTLQINLRQDGQVVLTAELVAHGTPLTSRSLAATAIRLPLIVVGVMFRIHWQALRLYLRGHLPVLMKPAPTSPATIPSRGPTAWHWLRAHLVRLAADRTQHQRPLAAGLSLLKDRT
jgi:DUF1365 family protein